MKTIHSRIFILGILALGTFTIYRCGSDDADAEDVSYAETGDNPDSLCIADPSWFPHANTPAPEEGEGSPFDDSVTTNQIFHQWSWQKFLWLTKPTDNGQPNFLNSSTIYQITSTMSKVTIPNGANLMLTDTLQAGSAQPVLHSNPSYNATNKSIVYYSIHMDQTMFDAATTFGAKIGKGIDSTNLESFPVGSFELKVSWIPASVLKTEERKNYFITKAVIMSGPPVDVAMLGMHVVGRVQNHPEFIWATFQHDDIAPTYNWPKNTATTPNQMLLSAKGNTSGIGAIKFDKIARTGNPNFQVFELFQYGMPVNPDGTFMVTSQVADENYNNIVGINACVKANLDDVWNNYFYNGSLWINMDLKNAQQQAQLINSLGYNLGASEQGDDTRGSVNCANITMETFTQTFQSDITKINASNLANCFSCHNSPYSSNAKSPLYISHVFSDYLGTVKGHTKEMIEARKLQRELLILQKSGK